MTDLLVFGQFIKRQKRLWRPKTVKTGTGKEMSGGWATHRGEERDEWVSIPENSYLFVSCVESLVNSVGKAK